MKNTISKRYDAENTIIYGVIEGEEHCVKIKTSLYSDEEVAEEFSGLVGVLSTEDVLARI